MHSTLGVERRRRPGRLAAHGRRLRQAVPHAGLLPDLRPVPGAGHRPRLAHLSRPQGRALRLFLPAVDDDPVRLQGARCSSHEHGALGTAWLYRRILLGAVRHALVHLPAADLLRGRPSSRAACAFRRWWSGSSAAALEIAQIHTGCDGDRRVRRAASSISTPATSSPRTSSRSPRRCSERPEAALAGARHLGPDQRRAGVQRASPTCRSSRSRSGLPARPRSWRSRRCWRRAISPRRCAIAGATRSSSISPSSCRWR